MTFVENCLLFYSLFSCNVCAGWPFLFRSHYYIVMHFCNAQSQLSDPCNTNRLTIMLTHTGLPFDLRGHRPGLKSAYSDVSPNLSFRDSSDHSGSCFVSLKLSAHPAHLEEDLDLRLSLDSSGDGERFRLELFRSNS